MKTGSVLTRSFFSGATIFLAITAFCVGIPFAQAQTLSNGLVITWSADTYVPPAYQGKRLPVAGSTITAWAMLFQGGKQVSLANTLVSWYSDDRLLQRGIGLRKITFKAPQPAGTILALHAEAPADDGSLLVANIQVPVIAPKVAIETPYPGNVFTGDANVRALPYFFNVPDASALSYSWAVNGVASQSAENPDQAVVNVGNAQSGTSVQIQITVANSTDSMAASASLKLIYQKL